MYLSIDAACKHLSDMDAFAVQSSAVTPEAPPALDPSKAKAKKKSGKGKKAASSGADTRVKC